jgi:hypothetical protein
MEPRFTQTRLFAAAVVLGILGIVVGVYVLRVHGLKVRSRELEAGIQEAFSNVRVLRGLFPICASCKKIRDDKGYWSQIESYIRDNSEAEFSHGICPDCIQKLYPDYTQEPSAPPPEPS